MKIKYLAMLVAFFSVPALAEHFNEEKHGDDERNIYTLENQPFSVAEMEHDLGFFGYIRAGSNINDKGYTATESIAKNQLGRLGNEPDNYWEINFYDRMSHNSGAWAEVNFMMANWDNVNYNSTGVSGKDYGVQQLYVELGGLPEYGDMVFWGGKRYFNRSDVGITDFFYIDYSGSGGGVKNAFAHGLELAYLVRDNDQFNADEANITDGRGNIQNLYVGYSFDQWKIEALAMYAKGNGKLKHDNGDSLPTSGIQVNGVYKASDFYGLGEGVSSYTLQTGYGLGAGTGLGLIQTNMDNTDSDYSVRFLTQGGMELSSWSILPAFYVQHDVRDNSDDDKTTLSAVVRPIYKVNQNFSIQIETGITYDHYSKGKDSSDLDRNALEYKLTVAPTFTLDAFDYDARPQIRTFVSAFGWNDAANNRKDESLYTGSSGEVRFGIQGEVWF